jgi:predicted  nucleic acid-binding Zn-ribbon protein
VSIDLDTLKKERDQLKEGLRELEAEQRKIEASLKVLRQQELKTKREIEALSTLIELSEAKPEKDEG